MNPIDRAIRFSAVGIMATLIHYIFLYGLSLFSLSLSIINVFAFLVATGFSFTVQQRFTFNDRLQGKRLNGYALFVFLLINSGINWLGGHIAFQLIWMKPLLPLMAAGVNFCAYWLVSSHTLFRK